MARRSSHSLTIHGIRHATCRWRRIPPTERGAHQWAFAASADGDSRLWDVDLTDGTAVVFGAEGKGVRPLVRRTCDATLSIPLAAGVESLNVSVAAAVTLFEARRQRSINLDRR